MSSRVRRDELSLAVGRRQAPHRALLECHSKGRSCVGLAIAGSGLDPDPATSCRHVLQKIGHWKAAGVLDLATTEPLDRNDVFGIYSITQPVTVTRQLEDVRPPTAPK